MNSETEFVYLLDYAKSRNDPYKEFIAAFKTKTLAQAYSVKSGNTQDGILFRYHQGSTLIEDVLRVQQGSKKTGLWIIREVVVIHKVD